VSRIRLFTAPTLEAAMMQVRQDLGVDALIIETQERPGQIQVVATTEPQPAKAVPLKLKRLVDEAPLFQKAATPDVIARILSFHQTPAHIIEQILKNLPRQLEHITAEMALAQAMAPVFTWPLLDFSTQTQPVVLVGPPGVGKTVTLTKLAVEALIQKRRVRLITTDTFKSGAVAQLQQLAARLDVAFQALDSPAACASANMRAHLSGELLLVDTPGINPFLQSDTDLLQSYTEMIDGQLVFTMSAGGDAQECTDLAACFRAMGATAMIVTKLDLTRRLTAVMAMMTVIPMARYSLSPYVATPLEIPTSETFVQLLTSPR
jgi:flagellar biosynthesis protein FlhF